MDWKRITNKSITGMKWSSFREHNEINSRSTTKPTDVKAKAKAKERS
jgi:hypothetical protein